MTWPGNREGVQQSDGESARPEHMAHLGWLGRADDAEKTHAASAVPAGSRLGRLRAAANELT